MTIAVPERTFVPGVKKADCNGLCEDCGCYQIDRGEPDDYPDDF